MEKKLSFKSTLSRVGLCYFTLMLITQLLQVVLSVVFMQLISAGGWWVWIISYVPLYCVAVPLFVWMMHKLAPRTEAPFGTAKLTAGGWIRWVFLCLGATYVFNMISIGITMLIGLLKGGDVTNPLATVVGASSPLATLLFACILAPVGEEFLFRKMLHDRIGRYGMRVYILVGGLIFSLFHANLSQLLYAFVLGVIFCYIYACTGKLIYTITMHIFINVLGSLVMPMLAETETGMLLMGPIVIVLMAVGIVIAIRRRWRFAPETMPQAGEESAETEGFAEEDAQAGAWDGNGAESGKREKKNGAYTFGNALRTPGMIAYTVLCVLLILVVTFIA